MVKDIATSNKIDEAVIIDHIKTLLNDEKITGCENLNDINFARIIFTNSNGNTLYSTNAPLNKWLHTYLKDLVNKNKCPQNWNEYSVINEWCDK